MALEYSDPQKIPKVLVSAEDALARMIVEIAENEEIPVQENKALISALGEQKAGPIISEKALKILAEVIAFLYHADQHCKMHKA